MLDWAPDRFRWMPHRLGTDPPGYTFPSFCNSQPLCSPERWALWQRNEREQYGPLWEAGRYARHKGIAWDVKGPCPHEKYTELYLHALHDGDCCPCDGECKCDCHGKYAEPNETLFDWIRWVAHEAATDPDVQPFEDMRFFETPHAQQQIISDAVTTEEKRKVDEDDFDRRTREDWLRHSVTTGGLKQSDGGIYLIDN